MLPHHGAKLDSAWSDDELSDMMVEALVGPLSIATRKMRRISARLFCPSWKPAGLILAIFWAP